MNRNLKHFDTKSFLNNDWQQTPLLVRQALNVEDIIDKEDLINLALEEDAESRIIIANPDTDEWQVRHGPFEPESFSDLPDTHWTLLVQAVDHWVPSVREILQSFNFLPRWRVDDIMISYSPRFGGVGPHYDLYDVFLIQIKGDRIWKTGQLCNEETDIVDQLPVKILSDFQEQDRWEMKPGDMLYLPPGVAHWGETISDSITLSVGFRAPSDSEFITDFGYFLSEQISEFERYNDQNIKERTNCPYAIKQEDIDRLKKTLLKYQSSDALLASWLGQYMTEPKYDDTAIENESLELDKFIRYWKTNDLYKNPSSRMAYSDTSLFADGQTWTTVLSPETLNMICQTDIFHYPDNPDFNDPQVQSVLWQLFNAGVVFFDD
jgi:50S ribosomal protein L16 3-hydroxylase